MCIYPCLLKEAERWGKGERERERERERGERGEGNDVG